MRSFDSIAVLIKNKRLGHPKHYSQSELSAILGYKNGQFISNVERGLCSIPLKMLKKIADTLEIDYNELKAALIADYSSTLDGYLGNAHSASKGEAVPRKKSESSHDETMDHEMVASSLS